MEDVEGLGNAEVAAANSMSVSVMRTAEGQESAAADFALLRLFI